MAKPVAALLQSKEDFNLKQRIRRAANGNKATKKYEKSKKGFLMRTYRNMKSRVRGVQKLKAHIYFGLPILDKETFYNWSLNNKEFNILFTQWEQASYKRTLSPSIDRVDSTKGYEEGNIRWITHSENSSLGSKSQSLSRTSILTSEPFTSQPPPSKRR